ncbi:MAG: acetate--CoA ligase [Bradymonadia bacterium]
MTSLSTFRSREEWLAESQRAAISPSEFWLSQTKALIDWDTAPEKGVNGDFRTVRQAPIRWFEDGKLNVTVSCLDRHAQRTPDKTAILWVGDEPGTERRITYRGLLNEVCRVSNGLTEIGVRQGDRVIIYMGMVPEAAIAMLACARIGAVHSVIFGGFSASAISDRIIDSGAKFLITQDEGRRGGRLIPLKATVDDAIEQHAISRVVVFRHTGGDCAMVEGRDMDWHDLVSSQSGDYSPAMLSAEAPLFILYTSGSTGKPKGVLHTCGGYLTYAAYTHRNVFGMSEDDIYACVADVGWITGHTYIVYGPLANGATTLMFESTPMYPNAGRYWSVVAQYGVNVFYTAPTALRALAAQGDEWVHAHDRSALRVLGTVGEPIDPATWHWYRDVVGEGRAPVIDTWWQTETGGICIGAANGYVDPPAGTAGSPMPGILPILFDEESGKEVSGEGMGHLCLAQPWPGQARTVYGDHERFVETYFSTYPGYYFTGDGCVRDGMGYYTITGRVDDVLNVSGHRIGTAEIEAVLNELGVVAEVAVVGKPHEIKGQGVCAFVVPQSTSNPPSADELNLALRTQIGAHARLDQLYVVPGLPKTRSGKCMRRILRQLAVDVSGDLGDISTLSEPDIVQQIRSCVSSI